jgi:hypothetical protein
MTLPRPCVTGEPLPGGCSGSEMDEAVAAAGDMHGFTSALTSFAGRDGEVAKVLSALIDCWG